LDWAYERHEVRADEVSQFVAGLDSTWRGLSVTMPCKAAIVGLGQPDEVVSALGVANTVVFDGYPGDVSRTRVFNTDVAGIQAVLTRSGVDLDAGAVVFGAGATARSCVYALAGLGVTRVGVRARRRDAVEQLAVEAAAWGIDIVAGTSAAVVISTVPAPVAAEWSAQLDHTQFIFDVLYNPWPTPLVDHARQVGIPYASGLDLLAAQAVGQVELMTGRVVPFELLREAAEAALGR
jgi:shikimate dehydrogenase